MISGTSQVGSTLSGSRSNGGQRTRIAQRDPGRGGDDEQDVDESQHVPHRIEPPSARRRRRDRGEQPQREPAHEDVAEPAGHREGIGQLAAPVEHQEVASRQDARHVEDDQHAWIDRRGPPAQWRDDGRREQGQRGERGKPLFLGVWGKPKTELAMRAALFFSGKLLVSGLIDRGSNGCCCRRLVSGRGSEM